MEHLPSNLSAADQSKARLLHTAASKGDLAMVVEILSQWPTQPRKTLNNAASDPKSAAIVPYEPDLWPFTLVLHTAIDHDQPEVVAHVFGMGHKASATSLKAVEAGSVRIFQALFDHGWDVNAPVMRGLCPPLW